MSHFDIGTANVADPLNPLADLGVGLTPASAGNRAGSTFYLDGSLAYKTPIGLEVYVSADNIPNRSPPASAPLGALAFLNIGAAQGLYDLIGTQFRIGVRGTF